MAEYIEREAAIEAIMSEPPDAHYPQWYADKIKVISAADVAPVLHGRWLHRKNGVAYCSECKVDTVEAETEYCPNCGAKMNGGSD